MLMLHNTEYTNYQVYKGVVNLKWYKSRKLLVPSNYIYDNIYNIKTDNLNSNPMSSYTHKYTYIKKLSNNTIFKE